MANRHCVLSLLTVLCCEAARPEVHGENHLVVEVAHHPSPGLSSGRSSLSELVVHTTNATSEASAPQVNTEHAFGDKPSKFLSSECMDKINAETTRKNALLPKVNEEANAVEAEIERKKQEPESQAKVEELLELNTKLKNLNQQGLDTMDELYSLTVKFTRALNLETIEKYRVRLLDIAKYREALSTALQKGNATYQWGDLERQDTYAIDLFKNLPEGDVKDLMQAHMDFLKEEWKVVTEKRAGEETQQMISEGVPRARHNAQIIQDLVVAALAKICPK